MTVGANELFKHYEQWAEGYGLNDRERLTSTSFGRKMSDRPPFTAVKGRRGKTYFGVSTRPV